MTDELIHSYLGPYHISKVIRHGGMSVVYQARQVSLGRNVAIKVLRHNSDPQFTARFKREAQTIAQLQHHNILPIYDYGEQNGVLYLVLQYIEGGTTLADVMGATMDPVAALRADGLAPRLVPEAKLHGVITVALRRTDLQHRAGAAFDDGDGIEIAFVVVDLRHADFETEQTESHGRFPFSASRDEAESCEWFPAQPNGMG